jgi:hypothetical protein
MILLQIRWMSVFRLSHWNITRYHYTEWLSCWSWYCCENYCKNDEHYYEFIWCDKTIKKIWRASLHISINIVKWYGGKIRFERQTIIFWIPIDWDAPGCDLKLCHNVWYKYEVRRSLLECRSLHIWSVECESWSTGAFCDGQQFVSLSLSINQSVVESTCHLQSFSHIFPFVVCEFSWYLLYHKSLLHDIVYLCIKCQNGNY